MTIKEPTESEILEAIDIIIQSETFIFYDCRCFDCTHNWNFDGTIENNPSITDLECPECFSTNVIWYRQTY